MGGSSYSNVDCDEVRVSVTPSQKQELMKFELLSLNTDFPPSCDGDNSSVNEGCESPLSSWDSEPETDIPSLINCDGMPDQGSLQSINLEENYLGMEEQNQFVGVENTDDGLLWEMDNRSYEELLKKFNEKEEELRVSNFKLTLSEQEIIKLNVQVENGEAQLNNVREELKLKEEELNKQKELSEEEIVMLKIQIEKSENRLDNVHEELQLKEEELNKQKELSEEEISKSKIQIEKSENQLTNVNGELKRKEDELKNQKELLKKAVSHMKSYIEKSVNRFNNVNEELKLKEKELNKQKELSEEEIFKLKTQIEKSEIQLQVTRENMANSELELVSERQKNQMLGDLVKTYKANETNQEQEVRKLKSELLDSQAKFSFDIADISKLNMELTSKLKDCQSRNKELENKLSRDRDAKVAQEMVLEEEINCLREELGQKMHLVEAANKEKEMVVIERNEAKAKIKKLEHEIFSCKAEKLKHADLHATQQKFLQDEIMSLRKEHGQRMDMVMVELDEANVMIANLKAEICSRDDKISNMKKHTDDVKTSLKGLMIDYDTALKEVNDLKLKVGELEFEVTRQNGVISDMAKGKNKEALRQVHDYYEGKLEIYKTAYNELLQKSYS
ncbi:CAP-Gly domain-containing linker protein 1-like [Trifolium pratense]|nr:CAP-Gly domain-containing linker protein 1-like [Trifolium pratense]